MNQASKTEDIFESDFNDCGESNRQKLAAFRESIVDKPASNHDGSVIENNINPESAFQVFNGKLFEAPKPEYYSLAGAIERKAESPLEKYSRIRAELDDLKSDLDTMVESEESKQSSVWSILQTETNILAASAAALNNHQAFDIIKAKSASAGTALTEVMGKVTAATSQPKEPFALPSTTVRDVSMLEERVHQLETLLGATYNNNTTELPVLSNNTISSASRSLPFPIINTINKLEERVALLDPKELDALRAKCNAVKLDLDTTIKSKSASSLDSRALEAFKALNGLIDQVNKIEAVATDLPNLVLRLKTLEHTHIAACSFNSRLTQMESDVKAVAADLGSNKDVLEALKEILVENMATMQQNINDVNNRKK